MLSEPQIKRVWEGMLGSEIRAHYFAALAGRYLRYQKMRNWVALFASSGAAAAFLAQIPPSFDLVKPGLALIAAGVSLYSLIAQGQKLAVDASDLYSKWSKLGLEYTRLWDNIEIEDAFSKLCELEERTLDYSKSGNSFPNNQKALGHWQTYVEMQHGVRA